MKNTGVVTMVAGIVLFSASFAGAGNHGAMAELQGTDGQKVGTVRFEEVEKGVKISAEITGLPEGEHAFHIHEKGVCQAPDFKSSGGHYNPGNTKHGFLNPDGPHAGDLPNILVGGENAYQWTTDLVSLDPEAENTVFTSSKTAIVIHQNPDDYITDPAGGGGKRIACGVIEKGGK